MIYLFNKAALYLNLEMNLKKSKNYKRIIKIIQTNKILIKILIKLNYHNKKINFKVSRIHKSYKRQIYSTLK